MVAFLVLVLLLLFPLNSLSATIYADNTLGSNCTGGNYSITNRNCAGSDGDGYIKIQTALNNMTTGDTVLVRGGTYQENSSGGDVYTCAINIPVSKNGDSWSSGHYNTLASYPGEWAIIDGQSSVASGAVLGHFDWSCDAASELAYWVIERLEIKNGGGSGNLNGAAGLWLNGGPFKVRYCYIHDNWANNYNNPSGVRLYRARESIVEYNYFYHNGGSGDNGQSLYLVAYGDGQYYTEDSGSVDLENLLYAVFKNEIRYNYFVGSNGTTETAHPIKYKAGVVLCPVDGSDLSTYKEYGDKIHHNIMVGGDSISIGQDFIQCYNNILDACAISQRMYSFYGRLLTTIYNNTIIEAPYVSWSESSVTFVPWDYVYSNLLNHAPSAYNQGGSNVYAAEWELYCSSNVTGVDTTYMGYIDKNYFYRPQGSDQFRIANPLNGQGNQYGALTVSEYNTQYSTNNYVKASSEGSDNITIGEAGADKYRTRSSHVISGNTTIASGGKGGNHPYLSGITIPSYVGATNPSDDDWVAGVLAMDAAWFTSQSAGSTPNWIEGAGNGDSSPGSTLSGITSEGITWE